MATNNNRRKLMDEDELELEEEINLDEDDNDALLNFLGSILDDDPDGLKEFNRLTLSELDKIVFEERE